MKQFPTIYKRTSTGAVQVWSVVVDGGRYQTTSGQIEGKKTSSGWVVAEAKNVGRANATTSEEQAIAEVEALYKKKLEKEYRKDIKDIDVASMFAPMLATKWADRKDKLATSEVYMQPKLDGIRCIAKADGLWTRQGKRILGAPHIERRLEALFEIDPSLIFDGELYNHDLKEDFNTIVSLVKKTKPTAQDLADSFKLIQYHIYDLPSTEGVFANRLEDLLILSKTFEGNSLQVVQTTTSFVESVDDNAMEFIAQGYEGAMVRLNKPYEQKRSATLIKWKQFQDEEFKIIDVLPGRGNKADKAASILLELQDGRTFNAGVIGNDEYAKKLLKEKEDAIGKMGTVVYFQLTEYGIPRFPKLKTLRDYE